MTETPKVEFAKDDGHKQQWVQWVAYKRDGLKNVLVPSKAKWTTLVIFSVPLILVLLQPTDSPNRAREFEPVQSAMEKPIDVPPIGVAQSQIRKPAAQKVGKDIRYLGPQVFVRPFMDAIPPGTMVRAVLISGASNGPVRAELQEAVTIGGETMAEVGSSLLGFGHSTDERLIIQFKKLVLHDGSVMHIKGQACDGTDKIAGLRGSNVGNKALRTAGSIGLGFVGGFAQGLQQTHSENGMEIRSPSLSNAALNGAATAALDQSRDMSNSLKEQKPVIEVKSGTPIFVLFEPSAKGTDDSIE